MSERANVNLMQGRNEVGPRGMVLHVRTMAGTGGGPEKTILNSPRHVDPQVYGMAAAYIHPENDPGIEGIAEQAKALGCPLERVAECGAMDWRTPRRLLEICRRLKVSIWHGHDYKSNLLGLMLRPYHPMKLITTVHAWVDRRWRLRLYRMVDEWCLPRYDHVVTVSSDLHAHCRDLGIDADRVTLVHNAIDEEAWKRRQTAAEAKVALRLDPGGPVIGMVGRLNHEKGVDRALRVIQRLRGTFPNLTYLVIGDGPLLPQLQKQVTEMGLQGHVRFCLWQQPLQRWYEAFDVLLLSSRAEGLPNVVLEAMAMGVAVAGTRVGGVADLLDDGRCGVLLGNREDEWAGQLGRLLSDEALREDYAERARRYVEEEFTFRYRMRRMVELYDHLTGWRGEEDQSGAVQAA